MPTLLTKLGKKQKQLDLKGLLFSHVVLYTWQDAKTSDVTFVILK